MGSTGRATEALRGPWSSVENNLRENDRMHLQLQGLHGEEVY